jgi:hypothetical protein
MNTTNSMNIVSSEVSLILTWAFFTLISPDGTDFYVMRKAEARQNRSLSIEKYCANGLWCQDLCSMGLSSVTEPQECFLSVMGYNNNMLYSWIQRRSPDNLIIFSV